MKDGLQSQFFAIVSHEIRTPLTGIIGMLNVFPKGSNLTDDQSQCLETIDECSSQLMAIVNDVLDYSKCDAGQMKLHCEKANIRSLLKLVKASFQAKLDEKTLGMEIKVLENVPEFVITDQVRLRQIVFNLVSNSIKFSAHGCIQITVETIWTTHSFPLWTSRPHLELKFTIVDEGIGIPESKWCTLFTPFSQVETMSTRRAGGTGLGLTICKKLVNLMSGEISLQKKTGPGTSISFTVIVELLTDEAEKAAMKEASQDADIPFEERAKPVLVVEDNYVNQQFMHRLLKSLDFPNVHFAYNGLEAVKMARKTAYSVIFMDNQMPVMDGYEASKQILAINPKARIACITGDTYEGIRDRFIALGVKAFLLKPFRRDALQELLCYMFSSS
ncbi:histidine kinase-like ATPase [Cladochytrium replicatum]|nr:histidine kinase-like ATPase [Cladochytrium replicatum]